MKYTIDWKDFCALSIGIIYLLLGVIGIKIGNLEHWKYWISILLGILFMLVATAKK